MQDQRPGPPPCECYCQGSPGSPCAGEADREVILGYTDSGGPRAIDLCGPCIEHEGRAE